MRQALRKVAVVVGFLMALGAVEKAACPNAEASYGLTGALETMGISVGIGTVLGLSTLPFYDEPTDHLNNALIGAGAGLIVGLGVAAYMLTTDDSSDEISPDEVLPPENKPKKLQKPDTTDPAKAGKKGAVHFRNPRPSWAASVPATRAMPLTPQWVVSMKVLELRF